MSNLDGYDKFHPHRRFSRIYTDPFLFYEACQQRNHLRNLSIQQRQKRLPSFRKTIVPQAKWIPTNPFVSSSRKIIVAKALYHRVLKK